MEPLVEIYQDKGSSEYRWDPRFLSGTNTLDECCAFEILDSKNFGSASGVGGAAQSGASAPDTFAPRAYVRNIWKDGIQFAAKGTYPLPRGSQVVNPFKMGVVASSDSHTGVMGWHPETAEWPGHLGIDDIFPMSRDSTIQNSSGGHSVVWAEENSRDSIFEALRRSQAEVAREAMALGLHHGDLVVRRILIDSATRLIRAVVLLHEPTVNTLEDYLRSIALSIYFLAVELVRSAKGGKTLTQRAPWIVASGFGLLHGLGFASALSEVGLPSGEIPLALFAFNVGIEAGQLAFVAAALVTGAALKALPVRWPDGAVAWPAYGIGSLAIYWFLERALALATAL